MRAVRIAEPISLDGRLDDVAWQRAEAASGFVQRDPDEGRPASEPTELRVAYDDDALYVGVRLFECPNEDARLESGSKTSARNPRDQRAIRRSTVVPSLSGVGSATATLTASTRVSVGRLGSWGLSRRIVTESGISSTRPFQD